MKSTSIILLCIINGISTFRTTTKWGGNTYKTNIFSSNEKEPHPPNQPPPKKLVPYFLENEEENSNIGKDILQKGSSRVDAALPKKPQPPNSPPPADMMNDYVDGAPTEIAFQAASNIFGPLLKPGIQRNVSKEKIAGVAIASASYTLLSTMSIATSSAAALTAAYVAIHPGAAGKVARIIGSLAWTLGRTLTEEVNDPKDRSIDTASVDVNLLKGEDIYKDNDFMKVLIEAEKAVGLAVENEKTLAKAASEDEMSKEQEFLNVLEEKAVEFAENEKIMDEEEDNEKNEAQEEQGIDLAEEAERKRLAVIARLEEEQRLLEKEKAEEERIAKENAEVEKRLAAKAEKERIEAEKLEKERIKAEEARIAEEKLIAEEKKAEKERIAAEKKAEKERIAAKKAEEERIAKKKAEEEIIAAEKKAEEERIAAENAEKERIAEEERMLAEAEKKRIAAAESAEKERVAKEKEAEKKRIAAEKAEEERIAAENAEKERIAQIAEAERIAAEQAQAVEESVDEEELSAEERRFQEIAAMAEARRAQVADLLAMEKAEETEDKIEDDDGTPFIDEDDWNASIDLAKQLDPELYQNDNDHFDIDTILRDKVQEEIIKDEPISLRRASSIENPSEIMDKLEAETKQREEEKRMLREEWDDHEVTDNYEQMTVAQLKEQLRNQGLKVSGRKAELIERLRG